MILELQRANRVGDVLDRVGLTVREIIGRIDAPFVAGARMRRMQNPVSTGSRRFMLPDAMSIFARSTRAPLGNSPARMRRNRSRFSSTGR